MDYATAKTTMAEMKPLQLFVRLLAGKTATLSFTTKNVHAEAIKRRIYEITRIPIGDQRLIYSGRQLEDNCVISDRDATIHLSLRLLGGKGGFGSLLRGAATKAGQKKTNNFDACRDMSGRRLRHVNAEKKLEEWRAGEEERRLEKMAEEFLKKKSKKGKGKGESRETERYVEKYREESGKCVAAVEEAVREAIGGLKRKGKGVPKEEAKKFKIWMGKRTMDESDSDDMEEGSSEEDSDEENEKSIVLNNGNHSDSSKELEGSSGSVTGGKQVKEFSGGGSSESNSEEEKEITVKRNSESGGSSGEEAGHDEENGVAESLVHEEGLEVAANSGPEAIEAEKKYCNGPQSGNLEELVGQLPSGSISGDGEGIEITMGAEANCTSKSESEVKEETVVASANAVEMEKPLNFDDFNSAAEMEVLGLERLKSELQTHGLKCGGTLQERAARLFLLKSTPLEMLPKKLFAKK